MGADLVDLQGSNSLVVFGWRVSSPVIARPEASMGRACSSHIWLNSMALTSRALSWPWELASGCGKGIVFPNTGALCCLCVIAYMCLCMITLTTQQARHLWHLGCAQGQLQLCHLMEKGGQYSSPIISTWQCWISEATALLPSSADGVHTKTALLKSVNWVNHLVYFDYDKSAGNSLSKRRFPTQNSMCKKTLLVSEWPDSCIFVFLLLSNQGNNLCFFVTEKINLSRTFCAYVLVTNSFFLPVEIWSWLKHS